MQNFIKEYQKETIEKVNKTRKLNNFNVGDTVAIKGKIGGTNNTRTQIYQGVVISKRNKSLSSSFVVRKISHGEGVNKRFLYYSPNIIDIQVLRHGDVRRAKLYHISRLKGKAARVKEKIITKPTK